MEFELAALDAGFEGGGGVAGELVLARVHPADPDVDVRAPRLNIHRAEGSDTGLVGGHSPDEGGGHGVGFGVLAGPDLVDHVAEPCDFAGFVGDEAEECFGGVDVFGVGVEAECPEFGVCLVGGVASCCCGFGFWGAAAVADAPGCAFGGVFAAGLAVAVFGSADDGAVGVGLAGTVGVGGVGVGSGHWSASMWSLPRGADRWLPRAMGMARNIIAGVMTIQSRAANPTLPVTRPMNAATTVATRTSIFTGLKAVLTSPPPAP
ncbi:hypothetical protein UN64_19515 [Fictibacillus arsenicus]|uniref:Uncharacterized protein n=1 Tax=Fictibacillus arsenicus TaxID=255247 RepID=A0A1V3FZA6_9BACL|nr:hypothetical protein UN64_19515 [Fictibacillus arsenicus]